MQTGLEGAVTPFLTFVSHSVQSWSENTG